MTSRFNGYRLIVALPEAPGCTGCPRGLFYDDTPDGHARAKEFADRENAAGFGIFECLNPFVSADDATFAEVLRQAKLHPPS